MAVPEGKAGGLESVAEGLGGRGGCNGVREGDQGGNHVRYLHAFNPITKIRTIKEHLENLNKTKS